VTLTLVIEGGGGMYRAGVSNASENVGYLVECETALGKQDDPCTGKGVSFLLENDGTTGTVLAESDAKTEEESETNILCTGTLGGKGLILAGADILFFSNEGLPFTVSE
jgi:predicted amidohydrolase